MSNDQDVVGLTLTDIRPMTELEEHVLGWPTDGNVAVLVFADGTKLFAGRDHEGNGPGAMFAFRNGDLYSLHAIR